MPSEGPQHAVVTPRALAREVDGELVILDLGTETYLGLDGVATRMWAELTSAPSVDDAHARLLEIYDVEPGRLRADLDALLADLVRRELLEIRGGSR